MEEIIDIEIDESNSSENHGAKIDRLIEEGFEFNMGNYLSKAWDLLKNDMGMYILFGFVAFLINIAGSVIFAFIPFVGNIGSSLLSTLLMAGYLVYGFKSIHNKRHEFGDFFGGFEYIGKLITGNLLYLILTFVVAFVFLIPLFMSLGMAIFTQTVEENMEQFLTMFTPGFIIGIIVFFLAMLYMSVSYIWLNNVLLFSDKRDWNALEASRRLISKNFFSVLGMLIVLGLINLLGAMALVIGLLVTIPLTMLTIFVSYHEIVGTSILKK